MGFLAKFYAEDIEHVNKGPIDALKSSGATKSQIISYGYTSNFTIFCCKQFIYFR